MTVEVDASEWEDAIAHCKVEMDKLNVIFTLYFGADYAEYLIAKGWDLCPDEVTERWLEELRDSVAEALPSTIEDTSSGMDAVIATAKANLEERITEYILTNGPVKTGYLARSATVAVEKE